MDSLCLRRKPACMINPSLCSCVARIGSLKHFSRLAAGPASSRAPGSPAERGGARSGQAALLGGQRLGGSFTEVAGLTRWQLGAIKGEVDLGKTLVMERRPGLRFGKVLQSC